MMRTGNRILVALACVALLVGAVVGPALGQAWAPADYATRILSNRPLPATDDGNFTFNIRNFPIQMPAQGEELTEEQAAAMVGFYHQTSHISPSSFLYGLQLYNDPQLKERIPSPALRSALIGLNATFAARAVFYYRDATTADGRPKVKEVRFADSFDTFGRSFAIGMVTVDTTTQQMSIVLNPRYRAENPFLFSATLAEFALHQDSLMGDYPREQNEYELVGNYSHEQHDYEHAVARAIADLVYLNQIAWRPGLASTRTPLSRIMNTRAALRLNSGLGARLGLYTSNGPASNGGQGPLARVYMNPADYQSRPDTPGNELLVQYLQRLQERGNPPPPTTDFSRALLDWIDQNQGALYNSTLVAAAMALKLDTSFVRL